MGKKKFIDKKKAVTFELCPRDSSDPRYSNSPGGDKVFVRVDHNPVTFHGFFDEDENLKGDDNSVFVDAPKDCGDVYAGVGGSGNLLPDDVRKEILELGFPDDGYNYLDHLREIKNTGGGSVFYLNPKAKLDELPRDVKAYDASRVTISLAEKEANEKVIYNVASSTVNVRARKVIDPEVAALLDKSDTSEVGSDVEDLEEDFLIQANLPQQGEGLDMNDKLKLPERPEASSRGIDEISDKIIAEDGSLCGDKPRARRQLDEQFDLLELNEYGSDSDGENNGYMAKDGEGEEEEERSLAQRLQNAVNENPDDFELEEKYLNPADILKRSEAIKDKELLDTATDIIFRCIDYAEKYENGNEDVEVVVVEESSDESEKWDCETIISTYSNLDNHPGKIHAPETARKKKLTESVFGKSSSNGKTISLKGKEKLPIDYLPCRKADQGAEVVGKAKNLSVQENVKLKRKPHGQESKEEKKERKAAVKKERQEARRIKKEMKGLYRCEAQRAQRAVAVSGPSSIHMT